METQLLVQSAVYAMRNPDLVALTLNDGSETRVYLNDGSPRSLAHDMLDAWLAKGNQIAES